MRHLKSGRKLGRNSSHRKAMFRNMVTSLLLHGQIKTTKTRAKAVRSEVDRIITLAKDGSLAARRKAISYLYDKNLVHKLFANAPERYKDRKGGYTRVVRTVRRRGDNAEMAIIELM